MNHESGFFDKIFIGDLTYRDLTYKESRDRVFATTPTIFLENRDNTFLGAFEPHRLTVENTVYMLATIGKMTIAGIKNLSADRPVILLLESGDAKSKERDKLFKDIESDDPEKLNKSMVFLENADEAGNSYRTIFLKLVSNLRQKYPQGRVDVLVERSNTSPMAINNWNSINKHLGYALHATT